MAGSLQDPASDQHSTDAYETVAGTGTTNDTRHVPEFALVDPSTGAAVVPGSFTSLAITSPIGQAAMAASVPVAIATNQSSLPTTPLSPAVYKTAAAAASGDTAVWTPASGKKFKLMRCLIQVTANAAQASGGVLTIALRDATGAIGVAVSVFVPGAAGTAMGGDFTSGWIDLGTGIVSSTSDNVLNVNLSAALTGGTARVIACGVEV